MSICKSLSRLWLLLSVLSLLVDVACFWLALHSPAPLPGSHAPNYIMIFLVSAPAPFVLALLLASVGIIHAILRRIWRIGRQLTQRHAPVSNHDYGIHKVARASRPQS